MVDINEQWDQFCSGDYNFEAVKPSFTNKSVPCCGELYISTITKLAYLNSTIPLMDIFWDIPMISYHEQKEGVVKKEMKFNCSTISEFETLQSNIPADTMVNQQILMHIDNPSGRIKFKDSRKISIGICKKDIVSARAKKKGAFYNCFVIIMRINVDDDFKDIHVKIFNTGNIKIPGVQSERMFDIVISNIVVMLNARTHFKSNPVIYLRDKTQVVLINSNFNCGYYVNREKLYVILKQKYGLNCSYDPCSYPGIHVEYYYHTDQSSDDQDGMQYRNKTDNVIHVHIKIFRTGSCLILGKCSCKTIEHVYDIFKTIFKDEYQNIN